MELAIVQFSDLNLPITLRNPTVGGVAGSPIDLTGCQAVGFVMKGYMAVDKTPLSFVFDGDRTTGKLLVTLTATQTGLMPYGLYLYEIKLFDSLGKIVRILKGGASVDPGAPNV